MPEIGDILDGRYRLARKLGEGGMGAVYEAEHEILDKRVAIKILHPSYSSNSEALERFRREARAASKIGHQGIVEVQDVGLADDGSPYLVMELLEGESLAELLQHEKTLSEKFVLDLADQILSVLVEVHTLGIVHRDLKPDNIFLCMREDGSFQVKLVDFGICKITTDIGGPALTHTGTAMGTPFYMSPEQAMGTKDVDLRTDIWSVGVILYEALTGRVPYPGDNYNVVIAALLTEEYPPLRKFCPDIRPEVENILLRAMAREPEERYDWAGRFLGDIRALGEDDSTRVAVSPFSSSRPNASDEFDTQAETIPKGQQDLISTEADGPVGELETLELPDLGAGDADATTEKYRRSPSSAPTMNHLEETPESIADTLGAVTRETLPGGSIRKYRLWIAVVALAAVFVTGVGLVVGLAIFFLSREHGSEEAVSTNGMDTPAETSETTPTSESVHSKALAGQSELVPGQGLVGVPKTTEGPIADDDSQAGKANPLTPGQGESSEDLQKTVGHDPSVHPDESKSERSSETATPAPSQPESTARQQQPQSRPLSKQEVRRRLGVVRPRIVRCVKRGGSHVARIVVSLKINGNGTTSYRGTSPHVPPAASSCIRHVIGSVRYRSTGRDPFTVRYPYTIRSLKTNPLR